jgi:ribosomal protein S14
MSRLAVADKPRDRALARMRRRDIATGRNEATVQR